jgi:hypothetical protein
VRDTWFWSHQGYIANNSSYFLHSQRVEREKERGEGSTGINRNVDKYQLGRGLRHEKKEVIEPKKDALV